MVSESPGHWAGGGRQGAGGRAGWDGSHESLCAGLQNPIDTMFHLQPLMFLGLFPLFAVFEGMWGHPPRGDLSTEL